MSHPLMSHPLCSAALKYSDSDSEADFPAVVVPPVPSAVPVTGESYCGCDSPAESSYNPRLRGFHRVKDCRCGEDDKGAPPHTVNEINVAVHYVHAPPLFPQ